MNVVIVAGGTGGHFFPAIALAEEFRRHDARSSIIIVGIGHPLEQTMLGDTNKVKLEKLQVRGVVGQGLWSAFQAFLLLPRAIWRAMRLLRNSQADLVIGTGGYISPPVVIAAWLLGVKRTLLEPNAIPGIANRLLGRIAHRIFLSFEQTTHYFNSTKVRLVGAPLRKAFADLSPKGPSNNMTKLLVCGGSQGSKAINTAMIAAMQESPVLRNELQLIHQTGTDDYRRVRKAYSEMGYQCEVVPFIVNMSATLSSVDFVISRCGALTLAEIAACGKPALLVPFPEAAQHHQEYNARVVEKAGAGIVVLQSELTGARLATEIELLIKEPTRVYRMAEKSLSLRKVNSTEVMVHECYKLVGVSST